MLHNLLLKLVDRFHSQRWHGSSSDCCQVGAVVESQ